MKFDDNYASGTCPTSVIPGSTSPDTKIRSGSLANLFEWDFERFYQLWLLLVNWLMRMFPKRLTRAEGEEVAQELFLKIAKQGVTALGEPSLNSLKKHTKQTAIDYIRRRDRIKRGGTIQHVEFGSEEFRLRHHDSQTGPGALGVEDIAPIFVTAWLVSSPRERVVLGLMFDHLPDELTPNEMAETMAESARPLFLPRDGRSLSESEGIEWIARQISRSRAAVRKLLKRLWDEM